MKFTRTHFMAINRVVRILNVLRRWTGTMTDPRYDEISKQAFNCMFAFFLSTEIEHCGHVVNYDRLIKCAIYRAFQKAYIFYDTPEHYYREICEVGGIAFEPAIQKATYDIIVREAGEEFTNWVVECIGSYEQEIYAAATKFVTFLELKENQFEMNGDYARTLLEVSGKLDKFSYIPGFQDMRGNEKYTEIFKEVSRLRNQNRWAGYGYRIGSAVSGHLFDTAIYGYMNASNKGEDAVKHFFIGIFHDIPEVYTRDIPSPVKELIPGFRDATEEYERRRMELMFYPKLPEYVAAAVREVALEEVPQEIKDLGKVADYLSAASEIFRQTPDEGFGEAMLGNREKFDGKLKGAISPEAREFYDFLEEVVLKTFGNNDHDDQK